MSKASDELKRILERALKCPFCGGGSLFKHRGDRDGFTCQTCGKEFKA